VKEALDSSPNLARTGGFTCGPVRWSDHTGIHVGYDNLMLAILDGESRRKKEAF